MTYMYGHKTNIPLFYKYQTSFLDILVCSHSYWTHNKFPCTSFIERSYCRVLYHTFFNFFNYYENQRIINKSNSISRSNLPSLPERILICYYLNCYYKQKLSFENISSRLKDLCLFWTSRTVNISDNTYHQMVLLFP